MADDDVPPAEDRGKTKNVIYIVVQIPPIPGRPNP